MGSCVPIFCCKLARIGNNVILFRSEVIVVMSMYYCTIILQQNVTLCFTMLNTSDSFLKHYQLYFDR